MRHKAHLFIGVLSLSLLGTVGCDHGWAAADGSFERTLNVTGPVDLDVKSGSGMIRVRAGGSSTVRVHGLIRARDDHRYRGEEKVRYLESHPPIEQTGNTIRIGRIENRDYQNNVSISYEIETPENTRLTAATGSGNLSVNGIGGLLDGSTGSGSISVSNIGGEVQAKTGSGGIEIDSVKGSLRVSTGSGSIRGGGIAGPIRANTGSGNVMLGQTAPGDVEVGTGSGSIEVTGVRGALRASSGSGRITAGGEPSGEWKLHASSGNIDVHLNSTSAFEVFARTSSGRVTVDHPVTVMGTMNPKEIRAKVRGGGPLIDARTGSGDVRIQ